MEKIRLHFTWHDGTDSSSSIYLISVDMLRADNLGDGNANAIRNELLNYIDSGTEKVDSDLMNKISRSEDEDDEWFSLNNYVIEDNVKTLLIQSWD